MVRFFIALAALCVASACDAAPTEEAFAKDMLQRLQSALPGETLQVKADEPLVIVAPNEDRRDDALYNLHRIYGFCLNASADDCESVKQDYVAKLTAPRTEASKEDLRILVRDQDYIDYLRDAIPADDRPQYRQIGEGLYALLALDSPSTISVPALKELRELGLTQEEAWPLAMKQTKAILPELSLDGLKEGQPYVFEEFEYLPSLLADTEWWTAAEPQLSPDLFATAVSDQFVFIAFMQDGPRLENFKQTVREDCLAQPRCISPFVYRFRNGRWVVAD
ncbi:hypothetical protein H0274_14670 [Altererythrobacter sp. CC-YST694]|uniref:hypothetical protein n=1 Tax=Altererythrobacter sp. CC-YST694 TaxID=2755038 RepID=UPI001D022B65|nr:hypothetical protein [Altererythrobacter sp. CC-YST694]MCB5426504.1 hypothetical protein [Altererythrobacter sp. CC-YST694]